MAPYTSTRFIGAVRLGGPTDAIRNENISGKLYLFPLSFSLCQRLQGCGSPINELRSAT